MVYPHGPSPLRVAVRYVDLSMCKYLVEHGEDVTIADKTGTRPYRIAVEKDAIMGYNADYEEREKMPLPLFVWKCIAAAE